MKLLKLYRIQWRWKTLSWHLSLPFRQIGHALVLLIMASLYPFYFVYSFLLEPIKVYFLHPEEASKIIESWTRYKANKSTKKTHE